MNSAASCVTWAYKADFRLKLQLTNNMKEYDSS